MLRDQVYFGTDLNYIAQIYVLQVYVLQTKGGKYPPWLVHITGIEKKGSIDSQILFNLTLSGELKDCEKTQGEATNLISCLKGKAEL